MWLRPGTSDADVAADTLMRDLDEVDVLPRTILDLGSNIGLTIALYAAKFPAARILGVELDSSNLEIAHMNTDREILWGAAWH